MVSLIGGRNALYVEAPSTGTKKSVQGFTFGDVLLLVKLILESENAYADFLYKSNTMLKK